MSRPAGWSDDEEDDSDYEGFGFGSPNRPRAFNHVQERVLTPEEKLFDAVKSNNLAAAEAAVGEGADVHARVHDHTALMEAASNGHFEVMEFLIQRGANVNDEVNMTSVLMFLCRSYSRNEEELLRCLRLLLENGANPNSKDWGLSTPLHMATANDHHLLVSRLLEIGCDPNEADGDGYTPIMWAVLRSNVALVKLLLESGAKKNVRDRRANGLADLLDTTNPNQEIADLLGIPVYDDTVEVIRQPSISTFKSAMLHGPRKDDRLYGYSKDAVRVLKAMNFYDIAESFGRQNRNIQLAELLVWSKEDWDQVDVHFSYHQMKMAHFQKKYHELPWGKDAVPQSEAVLSEGSVDPFLVVRFLFDYLRVMHITSATSLYVLRSFHKPSGYAHQPEHCVVKDAAVRSLKETLKHTAFARKQMRLFRQVFREYTLPPDLVTIKEPPKQKSGFLALVGFMFRFYVSWLSPSCSGI